MAQECLDVPHIGPTPQEMDRNRVPQQVRVEHLGHALILLSVLSIRHCRLAMSGFGGACVASPGIYYGYH